MFQLLPCPCSHINKIQAHPHLWLLFGRPPTHCWVAWICCTAMCIITDWSLFPCQLLSGKGLLSHAGQVSVSWADSSLLYSTGSSQYSNGAWNSGYSGSGQDQVEGAADINGKVGSQKGRGVCVGGSYVYEGSWSEALHNLFSKNGLRPNLTTAISSMTATGIAKNVITKQNNYETFGLMTNSLRYWVVSPN